MTFLREPWAWWVSGPLIGLFVPALLLAGNKLFGVSSSLRDVCAVVLPGRVAFFRYDWRATGGWNLAFAIGIIIGGALSARFLDGGSSVHLSPAARDTFTTLGLHDLSGLVPRELFGWSALATARGLILIVGGGFLVHGALRPRLPH